jgi:hypothetical protein
MYTERLQILLSPDQRRRLDEHSKEQGRSVGSLVREAVDRAYPERPKWRPRPRSERIAAVERIRAMKVPGPLPSAEELDRIHEEGIEDRMRRAGVKLGD